MFTCANLSTATWLTGSLFSEPTLPPPQAKNERNYHIFYELLAGLPAQLRQAFSLQEAETYYYLNQVSTHEGHTALGPQSPKATQLLTMRTGAPGLRRKRIMPELSSPHSLERTSQCDGNTWPSLGLSFFFWEMGTTEHLCRGVGEAWYWPMGHPPLMLAVVRWQAAPPHSLRSSPGPPQNLLESRT